ncbi:MAG: glycosyl hydrolase family 18 protein, partial [Spirochaetes bacterium]|nr:glycosyl hydrolase family 18 protein [Spirochaetota bacterium]
LPYQKHIQYWEKRFTSCTVLCFTGITINATECTIPQFTNETTLFKKAHEHTIALLPHITFTSVKDGIAFLTHPQHWEKTIQALSAAVRTNKWWGCHFDFEYLPGHYAPAFAQFLKHFRAIAPDIKLSAAIFPQIEFNPTHSAFHDCALLSAYLDEVVVMCYDLHNPKTKPGPVTSIQWTKKNIEYILQYFKPQRVWLGIPAYGYMWKNDRYYTVITMKSIPKYLALYSSYRHNSGTITFEYTNHNDRFVAYVPDSQTHSQLYQLVKLYNLKGVALWRLGFE